MAHPIPTAKQPRRDARYSREEMQVISKHKTEYKDQTTRALKANVLRNKILVDLFNFWDKQGTLPTEGAVLECVQVNTQITEYELTSMVTLTV